MISKSEAELICGRWFTIDEIREIQEIVSMFSRLSRKELAYTVCETLGWYAPNGKYKVDSSLQLLEKLEKEGQVVLPAKRKRAPRRVKKVIGASNTEEEPLLSGTVSDVEPIELEAVRELTSIHKWNNYVERYHILGYKRPFGAHQRYFIWSGTKERKGLGCMLFSAAAWALAERDAWIGWSKEERSQRLHLIVNNTRFLIFPWVKVKNLASKALSLAAKQVRIDFMERYGYEPVLLETFVDIERYKGTCYRAANWIPLGLTAGRGRMDRYTEYLSTPKQIFVYPLVPDFRAQLRGEHTAGDEER